MQRNRTRRGRETGVSLGGKTTLGSEAKSKMEFGFLPSKPIEKAKLSLKREVLGSSLIYTYIRERREIA